MNSKKWNVKSNGICGEAYEMAKELKTTPLCAQLLINRNISTVEKAKRFISFSDTYLHDPFLIPDMDKAVERIRTAIKNKEKIVIYGDYDVDGVTSVSILCLYFKEFGIDAGYYIPDRSSEGYGVNINAIEQFASDKVTLMITVDTGVTAVEETEYAKSLGIDVVITDHHECHSKLPSACAVVNPRRADSKYPFKELAGVGVVFKLVCALTKVHLAQCGREKENFITEAVKKYIDLVAMGTIADVMPLVDENRLFVYMGLNKINATPRIGLCALVEAAQNPDRFAGKQAKKQIITSSTISYTVAPRINAAGRIDNASIAVALFLTEDMKHAQGIADKLCMINKERQAEENRIIDEVAEKMMKGFDIENNKIIVLDSDNWHHGVIGIVASRITEKYGLPSILISFEGDIGKGSGRSVKGINLVEALTNSSQYLVKFGGHELAAGLTVNRDKLEDFKRNINEYVKERIAIAEEASGIDVDMTLTQNDITIENAESLSLLEPYGVANPTPLFEVNDLVITDIMLLGQRHTKITLRMGNDQITALRFGKERKDVEFMQGDKVDILALLNVNEFRDKKTVQFIIKDMKLSNGEFNYDHQLIQRYAEVKDAGAHSRSDDFLPSRDDVSAVYLYIKRKVGIGRDEYMGMREMLANISASRKLNYVKLRIILDILSESGVLSIEYSGENSENMKIGINFVKNKINIEASPTYVKVKAGMLKQ